MRLLVRHLKQSSMKRWRRKAVEYHLYMFYHCVTFSILKQCLHKHLNSKMWTSFMSHLNYLFLIYQTNNNNAHTHSHVYAEIGVSRHVSFDGSWTWVPDSSRLLPWVSQVTKIDSQNNIKLFIIRNIYY